MSRVAAPLRRRFAPAMVVAVAMLCAAPMSAQAEKLDRRDARRDVVRVSPFAPGSAPVVVPGRADLDIVRSVFRHKRHRVQLRLYFAELTPPPAGRLNVTAYIRTNERVFRQVSVTYASGFGEPPSTDVFVINRNEQEFPCRIYRSFDFTNNVIIVGIRRACLRGPRWIRVGMDGSTNPFTESPTGFNFVDEALRRGVTRTFIPKFSPRLQRASGRR